MAVFSLMHNGGANPAYLVVQCIIITSLSTLSSGAIYKFALHPCVSTAIAELFRLSGFFTGAESVPFTGFEDPFKVEFLFGESQKWMTASTCDLVLRIPTCHNTYEQFEEHPVSSILGSARFSSP